MNLFIIYMRACSVLAIILFILICLINSKTVAKYLITIANNAAKAWKCLIEKYDREDLKVGLTLKSVFLSAILAIIISVAPIINIIALISYLQVINVYIEAYKYFKEKE